MSTDEATDVISWVVHYSTDSLWAIPFIIISVSQMRLPAKKKPIALCTAVCHAPILFEILLLNGACLRLSYDPSNDVYIIGGTT